MPSKKRQILHKVMETQCKHLTMTQRNKFLKLLQKYEELFDGTLGTWKTYPVSKVHEIFFQKGG